MVTRRLYDHRERVWDRIKLGPHQFITRTTDNGRLTFDSRDAVIGRSLFIYRRWETDVLDGALKVLRREGRLDPARRTVIDVGANIGMTTTALLLRSEFDRAIAIEPSAENFRLLERNIAQNHLSNRVDCLQVALSFDRGEGELELSADNFGDHRIRANAKDGFFQEANRSTVRVPVKRLDDLFEGSRRNSRDVGLIWIDVQGHEALVFAGGPTVLAQGVPVVSEFWPYGIARTGLSQARYCEIMTERFEAFHDLEDQGAGLQDIARLPNLFERYHGPSGIGQLVLIARKSATSL